jgi:hypothetical protein
MINKNDPIMDKKFYYLGNQKLKRVNVPMNYGKKEIREFKKCSENPIYFIRNYVKIIHVDKGLINFDLWDWQEEMVNAFVNNRYTICKIPRQSGKTQTVAALLLWYSLFHENYSILVLAHKAVQSREILSRIQLAYENLPKWLQQGVVEWNKGMIELENGSKIETSATSASAARGTARNLVYCDEFAFVPSTIQAEFFASVFPTLSSGTTTKMIITSTPNGIDYFYKIWRDAERNKNDFVQFSVHWSNIPGRDDKWMQKEIGIMGPEKFRQEYGCDFIGSSNTLISPEKILQLSSAEPISRNDTTQIYKQAKTGNNLYVIVVDTSRGVGGDYSSLVVFDASKIPYEVVAVYKNNKISPLTFPNIIYQYAKSYNDAYVCIEVNDNGQQVADILYRELEYEHMVFTQMKGRAGQILSGGFANRPGVGVRTTKTVKRIGCANLKTLIETDKLFVEDQWIIDELTTFIEIGDSFQAEEGHHDDLVMCCVLFSWLVQQPYFKDWTDTNVRERLIRENFNLIDEEILPFMGEDHMDTLYTNEITTISNREFERFLRED